MLQKSRLLALIIAAVAAVAVADPPREAVKIVVSEQTTVLLEPLNRDGTVNYVEAYNRRMAAEVSRDDNAFIPLMGLMGVKSWPDEKFRRRTHELLNVPLPEADATSWKGWDAFMRERIPDDAQRMALRDRVTTSAWRRDESPDVAAWLDANEAAMAVFEQASRRSRWYSPFVAVDDPPSLIRVPLPHLGFIRDIAKAHAARANLRADAGDHDGMWADTMVVKRMSRLIAQEPLNIALLVGVSLQKMGSDLACVLTTQPVDVVRVNRYVSELESLPPMPHAAECWQAGERWMMLDAIQHAMRGRSTPMTTYWESDKCKAFADLLSRPICDANEVMRRLNVLFDERVEEMRLKDFAALIQAQESWKARFKALRDESLQNRTFVAWLNGKQPTDVVVDMDDAAVGILANFCLGGSVESDVLRLQAHAFEQAEIMALRVVAFRADRGRLPVMLEELATPACIDPFSDAPLQYRLRADRAIVYSVGTNREDNEGRPFLDDGKTFDDLVVTIPMLEAKP